MTLTAIAVHETLDERGLLDAAHGPGTYALHVRTPATVPLVVEAFEGVADATPPDKTLARLASADRVAYVGASGDVYDRLQDHADGEVRQALFLQAFDAVDVLGVWPSAAPFESEFNRARALSEDGWTCWVDGEIV